MGWAYVATKCFRKSFQYPSSYDKYPQKRALKLSNPPRFGRGLGLAAANQYTSAKKEHVCTERRGYESLWDAMITHWGRVTHIYVIN